MANISEREVSDARWPLLPAMLAGLGLVSGALAHLIIDTGGSSDIGAWRLAALSLVTLAPIVFGFVVLRGEVVRSAGFAVACGAIAAAILYFNGALSSWSSTEGWRLFSLALAIGIAAPLFQAWREAGYRALPYAPAHDHAWTNGVLWCLGWAFAGIVMAMAFLLAALFDLIGIKLPGELLGKDWVWRPLLGLAFGLGLALLREHSRIVRLLQHVAMLVLGVLAPVLALGLGLFLLALPFTGLQPLWDATKATTPILLVCIVGAVLLINSVIGDGDEAPRHRVLRIAALVLGVVLLPLAVIAQIATGLRIGQYGFTPDRLWALTFVILASIVAVAYLVCVLRGRGRWAERVRPANLHLAIVTCAVALLLATPIVSFNAISTRDQIARLESGKVTHDRFDWAALAFDFGEPGRRALEGLTRSGNAVIAKRAAEVRATKNRWDLGSVPAESQLAELDQRLRVVPRPVALPQGLRELLVRQQVCGSGDQPCLVHYVPGADEALAFNAACLEQLGTKAGERTQGLFCLDPSLLTRRDGLWQATNPFAELEVTPAQRKAIMDGYRRGAIEVRKVERRQMFIGSVPVGKAFE